MTIPFRLPIFHPDDLWGGSWSNIILVKRGGESKEGEEGVEGIMGGRDG